MHQCYHYWLRYAAICCIIEPPYLKRWNIRLCKNAKSGLLLMLLQIYPSQFCMEAKDETRRTWLKSVSSGGVDLHLKCKAHKWEFPLAQQSFSGFSTLEEEYSGSLRRRLLLVLRDVSTKGKCSFRPFSLSFSTLPSNGLKMLEKCLISSKTFLEISRAFLN